ncbi:roadblock/LC7 domain-containing protein [Hippea maritima]|uniref:Roadblock/LC7 family protein n=1 Tax=Hippea maritima (strain ATCC 700847 / DSM 10411 / MH2) TaxID=760142 RepID=F2LVU9_HIPMA|nr:roadblock/LC7 domain-containing protein [Hippea maritima]AEA33883.1 Roadblock/LC7 family protein [Hippea maritima DSM 10411]
MKEELINKTLQELVGSTQSIEGAALVTSDGLMISSYLPGDMDEDRVSAMSAALLSLSERAVEELEKGVPQQVTIRGDKGYIVITSAGEEAVLMVITDDKVKLGLLYMEIKTAAQKIKSAF